MEAKETAALDRRLVEGNLGSALLRFAVPFLAASFLQALYGAVDLYVVGKYASSADVSAVAIGSQIMHTVTCVVLAVSTGGAVQIGKRVGQNDPRLAADAVGAVTALFLIVAAILTPVMILCTEEAVALLKTPPEAVEAACRYVAVCSAGVPFIVGYNAISGIFRGIGDSRTPLYFIVVACIVNIAGDFFLTGYLGMAATGAAIATTGAQAVSFGAFLVYMHCKGLPFAFSRKNIRFHRQEIFGILRVGLPLAMQDLLVNMSFLIITMIINSLGLVASAAVGVVEKIISFAMLPASSFASAVATTTAQNMGAEQPRRAFRGLWYGIGYALVFGVAACLYSQFLPDTLTSLFSRDAQVIAAASQYLRSYTLDCILVSFIFPMNAYFSGRGKSLIAFAHSMAATFGVRIPATYFFSRMATESLYVMGLAAPLATLLSLVICLFILFVVEPRREVSSVEKA